MNCPYCNAEITAEEKICPVCGAPVNEEVKQEPAAEVKTEAAEAKDTKAVNPGKTLGIVGLILGIASILLWLTSCCCYVSIVTVPLAFIVSLVGVILNASALKKSKKAGCKNVLALIGMILSAVILALAVISLVIGIVFIALYGFAGLMAILSGAAA